MAPADALRARPVPCGPRSTLTASTSYSVAELERRGVDRHVVLVDGDGAGGVGVEVVEADAADEERRRGRARRHDLQVGREGGQVSDVLRAQRREILGAEARSPSRRSRNRPSPPPPRRARRSPRCPKAAEGASRRGAASESARPRSPARLRRPARRADPTLRPWFRDLPSARWAPDLRLRRAARRRARPRKGARSGASAGTIFRLGKDTHGYPSVIILRGHAK